MKALVFIQDRVRRIANRFGVHDLFVMHFPGIRLTQIPDALGLGIDHHDVLVTMRFLLATVAQGLFDRVFRALTATIGAVDNQLRRFLMAVFMGSKLVGHAGRQHAQIVQRWRQNRQQPLDPPVRARLAQPKDFTQQGLQRIGLLLHQAKQQFLLCRAQLPFAPPSCLALADTAVRSFVPRVYGRIGGAKRLRQHHKLSACQPSQRQQSPAVFFQSVILKHQPIVAYFA